VKSLVACLCLLTHATASAGAPGEAAIAYLEAVRDTPAEWEQFTAIFPGTTSEKKLIITERLTRLSKGLEEGDLRAVEETTKGDLGAVIVSQIVDFDPHQIQIHAVGLLKRDDAWLATPLLASFENTGLRYQPTLAKPAQQLEDWMLKQRNHHLTRLRDDILSDLLEDIRASKARETLRDSTPPEVVQDFILACRDLDIPRALAHLGGLDTELPDDWRDIVSITSRALHSPHQAAGQWLELTDPSILQAELETEADSSSATVTLGLFNAARSRPGPTEWSIRHFTVEKSKEDLWRIRLPLWLLEEEDEASAALIDKDLYQRFPTELIRTRERSSFVSPEALVDSYLNALTSDDFGDVFPHLARSPEAATSASLLSETSRLWRGFQSRTQLPIRFDLKMVDEHAWAICGGIDPKRIEIPSSTLLHLQLQRDHTGWVIVSAEQPDGSSDFPRKLLAWGEEVMARDTDEWLPFLGLDHRIGGLALAPAADDTQARQVTQSWIEALSESKLRDIFPTITGFDDDTATKRIFSFLGQELPSPIEYELIGIHRNGRWAGATVRHRTLEEEPVESMLLHPIVITPAGPRILPEAILYHATTRATRYLNDSVWKRLRSRLPEAAVKELEGLHQEHEKLCKSLNVNE